MSFTIEAIYENGVLRPITPLPLREHERVRLTVEPESNWVKETAGILGWKGSPELAEQFATDPELDFPPPRESP